MRNFPIFRKKDFFSAEDKQRIVEAVQNAELKTSGEVRVFVESRCSYMDAIDRAAELFYKLKMDRTEDRNGVLVYVAMKDRQLAVFGDVNIHDKAGTAYWSAEIKKMLTNFNRNNYAEGICEVVKDIGETLTAYFPFNNKMDKNELPDDILFGK